MTIYIHTKKYMHNMKDIIYAHIFHSEAPHDICLPHLGAVNFHKNNSCIVLLDLGDAKNIRCDFSCSELHRRISGFSIL